MTDLALVTTPLIKKCWECGLEKPHGEFSPHKMGVLGLHPRCKSCRRKYQNDHYKRNRRFYRMKELRLRFGLSQADYDAMVERQNGRCAVCQRLPSDLGEGRRAVLAVDHNHDTGIVRGLLCITCNSGLGQFGDDILRLEAAIRYLRSFDKLKGTARP